MHATVAAMLVSSALAGCNMPPFYDRDAREFLRRQGISSNIVRQLTMRRPLETSVAQQLSRYEHVAVLHLLGANPGTPAAIIERLARHENFEVRTGVAVNPNAPLGILLSLRTPGEYTTVNHALARNPRLPQTVRLEMYWNGEAGNGSFGMNPTALRT